LGPRAAVDAGGPTATGGVFAAGGPGDQKRQRHRGGDQDQRVDAGRHAHGDAGGQRRLAADQQVHAQQQQAHRDPERVAVDPGGDEQDRAGGDQDGRAGGAVGRPTGAEHLEDQQRRAQVRDAGRQPRQQVEPGAARRRPERGDHELDHEHREGGQHHLPLERDEVSFRRETLERSHGRVV
jgi:hypothetical protein